MLKMSASSMGTFLKCPKQYHYRYIEKPDVVKKKWVFNEFGSCAHRVLELFHEDLISNVRKPEEYSDIMTECFMKALEEFDQQILSPELDNLYNVIKSYLEKIKNEGLPYVIEVEKDFITSVGNYKIRGFIDRIDKLDEGVYHVVDYKTSKSPKYLTNFQLLTYAIAIKDIYPDAKKIIGSYCLLKHDSKMMTWEFSDEEIEEAVEKIKSIGRDITIEKNWIKKPSRLCDFCDYQDICEGNWLE